LASRPLVPKWILHELCKTKNVSPNTRPPISKEPIFLTWYKPHYEVLA
jgi:hypothetical protein